MINVMQQKHFNWIYMYYVGFQVDVPLEVVHLTNEYWNNVVYILPIEWGFLTCLYELAPL